MKRFAMAAAVAAGLAAVAIVASGAATQADKQQWKYVVVKLPPNTVDIEFTGRIDGHKLKNTVITPLDSLGRDGWELVDTVAAPDGGYVCFFKAPK